MLKFSSHSSIVPQPSGQHDMRMRVHLWRIYEKDCIVFVDEGATSALHLYSSSPGKPYQAKSGFGNLYKLVGLQRLVI